MKMESAHVFDTMRWAASPAIIGDPWLSRIKALAKRASVLRHSHTTTPLRKTVASSALGRLVHARPDTLGAVVNSYIAANWSVATRVARVVDHCQIVDRYPMLNCEIDTVLDLLYLGEVGTGYRVTLDHPKWLFRDGQATLSIWGGIDRLFSISFCLASGPHGLRAYVGGLQGRPDAAEDADGAVLDRYRILTKDAHGLRPRDLMIELFRMVCRTLGVVEILAVTDRNRGARGRFSTENPAIALSYDAVWEEKGGVKLPQGFFRIPLSAARRTAEQIPAKKRGMYKKRYEMLDGIELAFAACAYLIPASRML